MDIIKFHAMYWKAFNDKLLVLKCQLCCREALLQRAGTDSNNVACLWAASCSRLSIGAQNRYTPHLPTKCKGMVSIDVQDTSLSFREVIWSVKIQRRIHAESGLRGWSNLEVQGHQHCAALEGFHIMAHHLYQSVRLSPGKKITFGRKRPKGPCASCMYLKEALLFVMKTPPQVMHGTAVYYIAL